MDELERDEYPGARRRVKPEFSLDLEIQNRNENFMNYVWNGDACLNHICSAPNRRQMCSQITALQLIIANHALISQIFAGFGDFVPVKVKNRNVLRSRTEITSYQGW